MATADQRWQPLLAATRQARLQLDAEIAAWCADYTAQGKRLYCRAGCSQCCTLFVQTTLTEAVAIAQSLNESQLQALQRYVERQRQVMAGITELKEALRLHRKEIGPCPFLGENGACTIYPLRPLPCRALLSTRPADWCGVDFAELDPFDRQAYLSSLDRSVVAFPVHYVAATQQRAAAREAEALALLRQTFGLTISGNLPLLVHAELTLNLSAAVAAGPSVLQQRLHAGDFLHPLLFHLDLTGYTTDTPNT